VSPRYDDLMRGVVVAVLAVGACRAKPPEPLAREVEIEPVGELPRPPEPVLVPRPEIDVSHLVPDPTHELRWPLSMASHPELEPQFEIAAALAEPGVGWLDLCRLGAHNRHLGKDKRDHVAYLRGWCSVGKQDLDGALAHLVPLTSSVVLGLAPAVRADFANILVSSGDAHDASRLLSKHRIHDVGVLDTLAASYAELGKLDDAYAINEHAIANDDLRNLANRCRRLTRRIVLRPPPKQLKAVDLPNAGLFDVPTGADATCTRLEHELECWLDPVSACGHYHVDQQLDVAKSGSLVAAYFGWPRGVAGDWWLTVNNALFARPHPGADRLAVAAMTNALRATPCASRNVTKIRILAKDLRTEPHDPAIDADLTRLIDESQGQCPDP